MLKLGVVLALLSCHVASNALGQLPLWQSPESPGLFANVAPDGPGLCEEHAEDIPYTGWSNVSATMNLSSIDSTLDYTSLEHPAFSGYRVRIKKMEFCDHTVK